jgi:hypothetical protein
MWTLKDGESCEEFEMGSNGSSKLPSASEVKQAVILAWAVPYYMNPFWAVGYLRSLTNGDILGDDIEGT